jgi:hypothetical protein
MGERRTDRETKRKMKIERDPGCDLAIAVAATPRRFRSCKLPRDPIILHSAANYEAPALISKAPLKANNFSGSSI